MSSRSVMGSRLVFTDNFRERAPPVTCQVLINALTVQVNFQVSDYATDHTSLDTSVQLGLFLSCVSCHSSAEVFFLLNFFVAEGGCEVFGLKDLADLYVGLAFVGTALDPLDGLFERLDLPEPEAGDEFVAFGERAVNDGPVLAGEVDAGAFGRGVKTVVAYQDSGF